MAWLIKAKCQISVLTVQFCGNGSELADAAANFNSEPSLYTSDTKKHQMIVNIEFHALGKIIVTVEKSQIVKVNIEFSVL